MARFDQRLLNQYLLDAQARYKAHGFRPGVFDCCVYVAGWVELYTGIDPMAEYRDQYRRLDAGLELVAHREGSLQGALTARFGNPIHPAHSRRGDIAVTEGALGLFFTQGSLKRALFLGEGGMALMKPSEIDHAFRVGRE